MNNTVKITGGIYRGRRLKTPGDKTHPMGERERIALFNMILDYLPDALVVDAYAGSGALGLEAISRGVSRVIFVEKNSMALQTIKGNCAELGIPKEKIELCQKKVESFELSDKADMVLADPPYDNFNKEEIEKLVNKCLKTKGILVLSHPNENVNLPGMKLLKTKKYARAHISIYVK